MRRSSVEVLDMTATEFKDLAVKDPHVIYRVAGKVLSLGVCGFGKMTVTPEDATPLFASVGDSRYQNQTIDFPLLNIKSAANWLNELLAILGYAGRLVYFGGVSAQRTDQFFSRLDAAASIPEVTHVTFKGAVNNISQGIGNGSYVHALTGATILGANSGAQAAADTIAMGQAALAAGKAFWVESEEGIDATWPGSTWTAAMSTQMGIYNTTVRAWAQTTPGVLFIDWADLISDRSSATNKHIFAAKYDNTHDSASMGTLKAQYVIKQYPQALPPVAVNAMNPAEWVYTGTPSAPLQILDNPGFTTKTGGTLANNGGITFTAWATGVAVAAGATRFNAGNMYFTAAGGTTGATAPTHTTGTVSDGTVSWTYIEGFPLWASGQAVAANTYRINGGNLYATLAGGTTGATAPTHTTGSVSDGGVAWIYICPFGAWAASAATPAKAFRTNSGNLYYSSTGGTTGSTAPTHTAGTVSDGGVDWTYLIPVMSSVPQWWGTGVGSGGAIIAGTANVLNSTGAVVGVEVVMLALYSQANGNAFMATGSDYQAAFRGRQVVGKTYVLETTLQEDDHKNKGECKLQWQRGDMSNAPADGAASATLWTDTQSRYAGGLGSYPMVKHRRTQPMDCQAQVTNLTFSAGLDAGSTGGTLTAPWTGATGSSYGLTFSDGSTKTNATLTNGSTSVSWTGGIAGAVGTSLAVGANNNLRGTVAVWNDLRVQATGAGPGFAIVRIRNAKMYPSET